MFKRASWSLLTILIVACLLVAACGGGSGETTGAPSAAGDGGEPACPEPNPKVEVSSKELNLFVWTEYIPEYVTDCFEQVYGIKVNHAEFSSNEEMYTKLNAGGANYDLVQPTDQIVSLMIRQGLLQELDTDKLSIMDNFDPAYLNLPFDPENKFTVPYQAGIDAIVVNTEAVTEPLKSFQDLWNPDYAGRMVMVDEQRAIIGMTLLTLGYDVNTKDPQQLKEAKNKLSELAKGVKIFDSDSPKTSLIAGDADLGVVWTGDAMLAQRENPAIQFVYPTEGPIVWQDNYAIPKDAPHADAAYAWLNYTLQGDVFWKMLEEFPYTNPNKAALDFAKEKHPDLYDAYMKSNITNPPAEVVKSGHRIEDVGEATPLYDQVWTEIKGG